MKNSIMVYKFISKVFPFLVFHYILAWFHNYHFLCLNFNVFSLFDGLIKYFFCLNAFISLNWSLSYWKDWISIIKVRNFLTYSMIMTIWSFFHLLIFKSFPAFSLQHQLMVLIIYIWIDIAFPTMGIIMIIFITSAAWTCFKGRP